MRPLTPTAAALAATLAAMPPAFAAADKPADETSTAGCASKSKCKPVCGACAARCGSKTSKCGFTPKNDPEESHPGGATGSCPGQGR